MQGCGMKMQRLRWTYLLAICAFLFAFAANTMLAWGAKGDLQVYFVDVEGGQATLFVTPAGQSLLIDTGCPSNHGRDPDRILAATKPACLHNNHHIYLT